MLYGLGLGLAHSGDLLKPSNLSLVCDQCDQSVIRSHQVSVDFVRCAVGSHLTDMKQFDFTLLLRQWIGGKQP